MNTVAEIIELWPSASELARDLGLKRESHATVMKARKSIPVAHWSRLIVAARSRGIALTLDDLVRIHVETGDRPSPPTSDRAVAS